MSLTLKQNPEKDADFFVMSNNLQVGRIYLGKTKRHEMGSQWRVRRAKINAYRRHGRNKRASPIGATSELGNMENLGRLARRRSSSTARLNILL